MSNPNTLPLEAHNDIYWNQARHNLTSGIFYQASVNLENGENDIRLFEVFDARRVSGTEQAVYFFRDSNGTEVRMTIGEIESFSIYPMTNTNGVTAILRSSNENYAKLWLEGTRTGIELALTNVRRSQDELNNQVVVGSTDSSNVVPINMELPFSDGPTDPAIRQ